MPKAQRSRFARYRPSPLTLAAAAARYFTGTGRSTKKPQAMTRAFTRRRGFRSGLGVTQQYDRNVQYVRKSAPRRIKKRARKSRKNHEWNLIKDLGSNSVLRNSTIGGSWTAGTTTQFSCAAALYGLRGTADGATECGFRDVLTIVGTDPGIDAQNEKFMFTTGIMDITYTNTSVVQFTQEVDVYEIIFTGRNSGPTLVTDYNAAFDLTPAHSLGGVAVDNFAPRGITPFECPLASARGYKVIKKTKYFISAGNCFTYQIKDKGNKWLHGHNLQNAEANFEAQWRYKTRNVLFIAKPITGTPVANAGSFSIGVTRKYLYKTIDQNADFTTSV